jgi:NADPH:quinone reductase
VDPDQQAMRAIVMHQTGGPEVLKMEEVPVPKPGPGQILIRIEAIGVNFFETQMRAGYLSLPAALPLVPGAEAAGVVTAVGDGTDPGLAGQRVAVVTGGLGSYAEYAAVPVPMTTVIPDGVSPADAMAAAPAAVALGVLEKAALAGGETVLAEAGAGAVGSYLIQLARQMGARRIIATAGSPARRERARALGAEIVLDHTGPGWPADLRDALEGATIDAAFESIGGPAAQQLLDALTPDTGRMLCYGNLSGEPTSINLATLRGSGATVIGCGGPAWFGHIMGGCRPEIFRRVARGELRPLLDEVLPLDQAAQAHQRIDDRAAQGKIVLVP